MYADATDFDVPETEKQQEGDDRREGRKDHETTDRRCARDG
ncbi:hypothetical protein [Nocardia gipuzkoensis]